MAGGGGDSSPPPSLYEILHLCSESTGAGNFYLQKTKTQNILVITHIKYLFIHNPCTYNVRSKQCPHDLSNKLQVFYENLQVFLKHLLLTNHIEAFTTTMSTKVHMVHTCTTIVTCIRSKCSHTNTIPSP